ncbi:MAG: ferrous iron transport protein A [Gammaproteobacteria bacterium]|nr:ferrous iron transport protein A [Gammaproteobacteria bacterium]
MSATLSMLEQGNSAQIVGFRCEGDLKQRLASMGFVRGAKVTVDHATIMNGPRTYNIKGNRISLRSREADTILVELPTK